ncbi:MAG: ABC-2 transporter permease [Lachnospira sp.]|nr:ABC-2 transporter permease [Lachnospira sp.]
MKGLLYKEWCLQRKTIFTFVALALVFSLLGILMFISMKCGNLKGWQTENPESAQVFLSTFTYVPYIFMLLASQVCNAAVCSDYETGWMKYAYTLPVTGKVAVGTRYLFGCIAMVTGIIYGLVNALAIYAFAGLSFDMNVIKYMLIILLGIVLSYSIFMPVSFKFKKKRTVSTISAVVFAFIYFGAMGVLAYCMEVYDEEVLNVMSAKLKDFCDVLAWFVPFISVAVLIISFGASVKIYQRREKIC